MDISIIIPTYNEEATIDITLNNLRKHKSTKNYVKEIIVIDAESSDKTANLIKAHKDVILLTSKKGRSLQMNFGVKYAKGSVLYFLHADSTPPKNFDNLIIDAVQKNHLAGCFRMQFDSHHPWMRFISWLTKFKYRACRGGDQSLFVTKSLFNKIGGFDESYLIFEDHDILYKLYKKTKFKVIQNKLTSSSRRYKKNGIFKLQLLFLVIYVKKWLGNSPKELYTFYTKYIN